jgi:cytochrome c biogenesis factor
LSQGNINKPEVDIPGHAAKIRLEALDASTGTIHLNIRTPEGTVKKATAVVEFTRVPLISLVWLGSILQILGCMISLMLRYRKKVTEKPKAEVPEKEVKKTAKR